MKIVNILLATLGVLLVQTMILNRFHWLQNVDLFLLLNIYFALNSSPLSCIPVSVGSGFIQDAFSEGIIGMNAFSKMIVAYLISTLSSRLMIKHPLIIMILVGIGTLIDSAVISGLHRLFGLPQIAFSYQLILLVCSMNMFVGLITFHIADRLRVKKEYA